MTVRHGSSSIPLTLGTIGHNRTLATVAESSPNQIPEGLRLLTAAALVNMIGIARDKLRCQGYSVHRCRDVCGFITNGGYAMSSDRPHVIPFIKEIMSLRMKMKADAKFAASVRSAIAKACSEHGVAIPPEAIAATIIVHPEEVATTESVGSLPVGSQCQAW